MSQPLPEPDFDLNRHFLPEWAQRAPEVKTPRHLVEHEKGKERPRKKGQRDRRPPRDDQSRRDDRHRRKPAKKHSRQEPAPLPEVEVNFIADDKGVDSIARQIKVNGRAFPLFEIAQMVLQKPERHYVKFSVVKKQDGTVAQPLYLCALDDTVWLSEEEAIEYCLDQYFSTFYQAEKIPTDPPKGQFTFVAQCGMTGTILGPPNHHDYQNQLRKLHARRFPDMPFETFKSRVKIVRDPEVVQQWLDDQSYKTEYICLNVSESQRLHSREEVQRHFREVHAPSIIRNVKECQISGPQSRKLPSSSLHRAVRRAWEDQKRFPLKVVHVLSQQFAKRGLQFFKVNKTVTHVSVARPRYLDLEKTPVTEGVRKIVRFIEETPKCTRRKILDALAPSPEGASDPAHGEGKASEAQPVEQQVSTEGQSRDSAQPPEPTEAQKAVIADLHWLIHEGHVIEFANGYIETAKPPASKQHRSETIAGGKAKDEEKTPQGGAKTASEGSQAGPQSHAQSEETEKSGESVGDLERNQGMREQSQEAGGQASTPEASGASQTAPQEQTGSDLQAGQGSQGFVTDERLHDLDGDDGHPDEDNDERSAYAERGNAASYRNEGGQPTG